MSTGQPISRTPLPWAQQVRQPKPTQHLGAQAVENGEADRGTTLNRFGMDPEGGHPEWHIDDICDRLGDYGGIDGGLDYGRERGRQAGPASWSAV